MSSETEWLACIVDDTGFPRAGRFLVRLVS